MTTTHSYPVDKLQLQPLAELPKGSIFYLPDSVDSQLYVKLDSEGPELWLLTLDAKFSIKRIPPLTRPLLALALPPGKLQLAIEKLGARESKFLAGSLMLARADGAVMAAHSRDAYGSGEDRYVSILTWSFVDLPGDSWSLVQPKLMWHPAAVNAEPVVLWPPTTPAP